MSTEVIPSMYPSISSAPSRSTPHIFLFSLPGAGHVIPLCRIAAILHHYQYQVTICTSASYFTPSRLATLPSYLNTFPLQDGVGEDIKVTTHPPFEMFHQIMKEPLKRALLAMPKKPDLIFNDLASYSGAIVAEELGIPCVSNYPGPYQFIGLVQKIPKVLLFLLPKHLSAVVSITQAQIARPNMILIDSFWGLDKPVQKLPPTIQLIGLLGGSELKYRELNYQNSGESKRKGEEKDMWEKFPEIKKWIEWEGKEREEIIFLTTGSVQPLTEKQVEVLIDGLYCDEKKLEERKWRLIWGLPDRYASALPSRIQSIRSGNNPNILIVPWVPQIELIEHPHVKLVITHCGWGGVSEVVTAGKPIVALPFGKDQPMNAQHFKSLGAAEIVDPNSKHFTPILLRSTVVKVLSNPTYSAKMKELQTLAATVGQSTAHKIVDAVEYVRRSGGSKSLAIEPPTLWQKYRFLLLITIVKLSVISLVIRKRHGGKLPWVK